jgi:hypothetical protein
MLVANRAVSAVSTVKVGFVLDLLEEAIDPPTEVTRVLKPKAVRSI